MPPKLLRSRVEYTRNLKWKHEYQCGYCSGVFTAIGADVKSGRTKSCGCLNIARIKERRTLHGLTKCPEHRAWVEMKRRCYDVSRPGYKNYGGRGIKVCEQWRSSFNAFMADLGRKPDPSYSLDRIDNDKDYEPGNCRWADRETQSRNQRRHKGKVWT